MLSWEVELSWSNSSVCLLHLPNVDKAGAPLVPRLLGPCHRIAAILVAKLYSIPLLDKVRAQNPPALRQEGIITTPTTTFRSSRGVAGLCSISKTIVRLTSLLDGLFAFSGNDAQSALLASLPFELLAFSYWLLTARSNK